MNANIEETIKNCHTFLDFMEAQPKDKTMSHEIPERTWVSDGADIFSIEKALFCIVNYHNKFLVIKQVEQFSAEYLIKSCKIFFSENGMHNKIISDVGTNFILEKIKNFCKALGICMWLSSSYNYQSNRQVGDMHKICEKNYETMVLD